MSDQVNNAFYDELGDQWYHGDRHAIGLLRAESGIKLDFVRRHLLPGQKVLDVACGGGLVANPLAREGFSVTGVDLSENSLQVARDQAVEGAQFVHGNALQLPFAAESFDAVLLMDFLEHVSEPERVLKEASRVLVPGGLLMFSTFNRNWASRLLAIEALRWFPESPPNVHVYELFLTPDEVRTFATNCGLELVEYRGSLPKFFSWPFWSSVFRRRVHQGFSFEYTSSLRVGYMGCFRKTLTH
ncbi:MAG: 3-demethylubiquinone-9 3-O-methyltransferase [Bdellovibrionaceae bacterium]|nr:3-demethylubiquinone-9 3-O-methyltransferase [Pseudobdellovibrionaceae bacterium]